jgi:multiple antibiotic resistance protein
MSTVSAAFLLFLVMDPVGNIPLFVSALKAVAPERQARVVARELLIAYAVLVAALFGGQYLMDALGISASALTIGGGVVLFLIALRMVFPTPETSLREDIAGEPLIVPLAIPYVAGPSALATVMLLSNQAPGRWQEWLLALTGAWFAGAVIMLAGSRLQRRLGTRGLIAMERLMGMVLVAIAVQMFLTGIESYLKAL